MKNTGTNSQTPQTTPVVSPAFSELLPPLTDEQLSLLEDDLLLNGCYSPIIVMDDLTIVDGHHRFELCEEHGLPYSMAVFTFEDTLEAQEWALATQKARRNLSTWELGQIALKLKPEIEERAKSNQGTRTDLSATLPESSDGVDTRQELAEAVGIGERTMGKIMQIDEHGPESVKEALDSGNLSVNKGYEITRQVADLPEEEQEEAARQAVDHAKADKQYRKEKKTVDDNARIAKQYSAAFEKATCLDVSETSVRAWVEWSGIRKDEISDMTAEAEDAASRFTQIAAILQQIYEKEVAPYEQDSEEYDDKETSPPPDTE